ncbi:hypothetical protein CDAR_599241 [Caerostris darwini]|uniref:Uncharacterized protein n=1 Tax=Caerostris darwini TaxID=1538125 RepID=A0AAV4PWQ1_9ARAC|nr:hypothetical protein CDAR_599241 [Caerostris darwini]
MQNDSNWQKRIISCRIALDIGVNTESKFSKFIKRIPGELNKYGISFHPSRDLNYFLDFLSNSDVDYKNEVKQRLEKMYQDGSSLEKIKETMNAEFLAYKLNCSLYKAYQLLEKYPPLKQQSISVMSRVIDILFEQLHLSVTKIYNTPKLLSLCPETTERVLKKFPKVLGVKIEELVQMQPLLLIRTDTIGELEKILQKFDISHKQFLCCSKIINLHSEIIEERLTSLCSSKEFSVLKSNKKFLWLVYHYERLNHRLEALKAVNLPYSIGIFTTSNKSFQGCLSKSSYFANVNEIADYLGDTLNMCNEEIKYNLKEHPNVQTACLFNAAHVVNFLLNVGVSKQQIRNGLAIILYNVDNVKLCFESLPTDTLCQPYNEWVSHYNFLQLVIYVLEKKYVPVSCLFP